MCSPRWFLSLSLVLLVTKKIDSSEETSTDIPVGLYQINEGGDIVIWDDEDYPKNDILFHWKGGWNIKVSKDGKNMFKAMNDLHSHSAAMTTRPLLSEEVFEVFVHSDHYLEYPVIGVTAISPEKIRYPEYMSDLSSGTWGWDLWSDKVYRNGKTIRQPYMHWRREIKSGDRFGVSITDGGALHFHHNGEDLGPADYGLNGRYYAYVELYWGGSRASIAD